ncbi:hypothetical protein [Sedimenticola sp.]|uniref:hypothetical protein n=1 Tax=Sedimenticola sp. TaxID=1940285 RepID=UPI003D0BCB5E
MSAVKKTAISLVTLLIIVVIGVFIFLSSGLGSLIVEAVESFGPKVTQSTVSLDSADVAITGEGQLSGLTVGNPSGYKSQNAFQLGAIKIAIDPESLTTDVIHIKSINIESPKLSYEPGGKAGSNLKQLVKNVQQFSGGGSGKNGEEKEKKLIIDLLTIRDGEVSVVTPLSDAPITTKLPNIEMRDIGKKSGGSSASDVVKVVMQKVTGAAANVGDVSLDELKNKLQSQVGDKLKAVQDQAKSTDGVGEKAGEMGNKLKSIFE